VLKHCFPLLSMVFGLKKLLFCPCARSGAVLDYIEAFLPLCEVCCGLYNEREGNNKTYKSICSICLSDMHVEMENLLKIYQAFLLMLV